MEWRWDQIRVVGLINEDRAFDLTGKILLAFYGDSNKTFARPLYKRESLSHHRSS
jgi:hypothetical protein